jgi:hypothetical protein
MFKVGIFIIFYPLFQQDNYYFFLFNYLVWVGLTRKGEQKYPSGGVPFHQSAFKQICTHWRISQKIEIEIEIISQPASPRPSVCTEFPLPSHPILSLSLSLFSFFSLSLHPLFQHFIATKCTSKTKVWNACVFPLSLLGQFKGRSSGSRFFVSPIESRIKTEKKNVVLVTKQE